MADIQKLKELAMAAKQGGSRDAQIWNFVNQVTPATILELIARLEAAEELNNHLELAVRKAEGVSAALRKRAEDAENKLLFTRAAPPAPVKLPEPYCVVCDYVYDAQQLRDALDAAGVKWVRNGEESKDE
ncbi:hypothetical protein [[Erwinia] mediterraneensis]|uniref:hypothetical protein n=1 Tax=[Erwinia] mediterraneensis TaxID=2161819 RepID=UPI0010304870|nr:hypothetical protein [[Erwinia] mediterraneensis]